MKSELPIRLSLLVLSAALGTGAHAQPGPFRPPAETSGTSSAHEKHAVSGQPKARQAMQHKTASPEAHQGTMHDAAPSAAHPAKQVTTLVGRAQLIKLPAPIKRIAIGNPGVADYKLVSSTELYVLGKSVGSTNLITWDAQGRSASTLVEVSMDLDPLAQTLQLALPEETGIELSSASTSIVLRGQASDALAAEAAVNLAEAHARNLNRLLLTPAPGTTSTGSASAGANTSSGGTASPAVTGAGLVRVINLLKIRDAQQVMLEVRIAEVSKSLLDQFGLKAQGTGVSGNVRWSVLSDFLGGSAGVLNLLSTRNANNSLVLDAEKKDGLVKILAEPTIVAMSGQEGSFLVGGKVFLPVTQAVGGVGSGTAVTLQEREFGIGLKFVPTVLDRGRISLKVAPEVSELSKESLTYSTGNSTSVIPAFTTRKVSTTVQLRDRQSLVIGGLIRNNVTETIKAFPVLGEVPILGALFRSTQFNSDQTELVVVVSPTLVKGIEDKPPLPTDKFVPPSRVDMLLGGKLEGTPRNTATEANNAR